MPDPPVQESLAADIDNALRRGDTAQAESLCRQALARRPQAAQLHLLLGQLLRRRGGHEAAAAALRDALRHEPRLTPAWRELAVTLLESGQLDQAAEAARQLRKLMPGDAQAAFLLGHVLGLLHRFDEAEREFAPLRQTPLAPARLGLVQDALARRDAAVARFHAERLVDWLPQQAAAWDALGQAAAAAQDWPASTAALREASRLAPRDLAIWQRRAAALDAWRQGGAELVEVREQLLRLQPQSAAALEQLGLAQVGAQRTQAAVASFRELRARAPGNLLARWMLFHTPALPCFASAEQRAEWLQDWQAGLAGFEALPDDHTGLAEAARQILGSVPDFALAYQDGSHVDLHRRHAALVRRLVDAATDRAYADVVPRQISSGRRRIGLVSSCLHRHSVTRAWGEALLALPREDFELCVFHTGSGDDAMARRFRARADRWHGGAASYAAWVQRLREAELDVLIFLDLGLDVTNQALAALRHAPVQAVTWAHPVTSGAAAIDWFLGADAAEPADAQAHYSETLHRLPRLGGCFARPEEAVLPRPCAGRGAQLMCLQNLYKLHPQHDALFGAILAQASTATLEFLTGASPEQAAGFEQRLQRSLAGFGVDPARVRVQPALAAADYQAALGRADLLLDTLGFSGGITTLDALWQERPWLTLPGSCMRGRQSFAMLRQLGLDALIAGSPEDYVRRAVALATDADQRRQLGREIGERKHQLFEDHAVSAALADFLRQVQPRSGGSHA
jgi:protein O-GlcNAc transferase